MPDREAFDVQTLHGHLQTNRADRLSVRDIVERVTWSHPDRDTVVGWLGAYGEPRCARVTYRDADPLATRLPTPC